MPSALVNAGIKKASEACKHFDPTLTDQQAYVLGAATVLGTMTGIQGHQTAKEVMKVIGNIKTTKFVPTHVNWLEENGGGGKTKLPRGDWKPEDGKKTDVVRKTNVSKAESKIWKELKHYRGDIKTNGLTGKDQRFYKWDFDHNEIEVYGPRGKTHLGAADPTTGEIYRAPVKARTIRGLIK